MRSEVFRRITRARAIAGVSALACCFVLLAAASALADTPPTLSVSLNKLPAGAGYTVTAKLSAASTEDCTMGTNDPTQALYPDLSASQDPSVDPAPADAFAGALLNPVDDQLASSCDATSWTTSTDTPYGVPGSNNPPGLWYFQAAVYCTLSDGTDATDADCLNPLGYHYTNVAQLKVPTATGTSGTGGSGGGSGGSGSGSGGSGSGSGGSGSGSGSGGSGSGSGSSGGTPSACRGLKGQAASQCRIAQNLSHALAICAKKKGKQKTTCRKSATVTDHKQLALLKCQTKKGSAKATCIKKANAIKA